MEKKLVFLTIIMMSCFFIGCKKAPINEKIEGHWLVESITTLEDNETTYPYRLYYGIGRTLTELFEKQGNLGLGRYLCRTEYRENETVLVLKDFVIRVDSGDKGETPTREKLEPYGIINPQETVFNVLKSTRKRLVIESDWARIELKRF